MDHDIAVPTPTRAPITEEEIAAAAFLARYKGDTRKLYFSVLRLYFTWCRDMGLRPLDVQRVHIELYARHLEEDRHNAPATVHHALSILKGYYRIAVADQRIDRNPTESVRMPRVQYDETKALAMSRFDMSRMIYTARAIGPMEDALVSLMAMLGLRVSEACRVNIEDFQDTVRGHRVLTLTGKGGKRATIPLPPPVMQALLHAQGDRTSGPLLIRRDGVQLERRTAYRWIKRIARKAGLDPRTHPHALRHGAVTGALDAGVPLRDVQTFARHSDPRITTRYDRARQNLDRHAAYPLAAYLSGAA